MVCRSQMKRKADDTAESCTLSESTGAAAQDSNDQDTVEASRADHSKIDRKWLMTKGYNGPKLKTSNAPCWQDGGKLNEKKINVGGTFIITTVAVASSWLY